MVMGFLIVILTAQSVNAVCVVSFTESGNYSPTETITAQISCSAGNEKSNAYTLEWVNTTAGGNISLENDTGTTPATAGQTFTDTFVIPAGFIGLINATITGTNLEGSDLAGVSAATANSLIITDIKARGTFLGLSTSIDIDVEDENGKSVSGGFCSAAIKDPTNDENLEEKDRTPMVNGDMDVTFILDYERFREGKDYIWEIVCVCMTNSSENGCIDEDGTPVDNSVGSVDAPFTTSTWIEFINNPLNISFANGTDLNNGNFFAGFDFVHWIRNTTNNNPLNESLAVEVNSLLINNATGTLYGTINQGQEEILTSRREFRFSNSSNVGRHLITQTAITGQYVIVIAYNIFFKRNILVAQYIINTELFNITGIQDTMTIHNTSLQDIFDAKVNTSVTTQSLTAMPNSNRTEPFILLTEGFKFDFCINLTNSNVNDITVYAQSLFLENPTTGFTAPLIDKLNILGVVEESTTVEVCKEFVMPFEVPTHSDYRVGYDIHIGTPDEDFNCPEECDFEGHTDFFYVAAIEDMIEFPKFITSPNSTDGGNPGIFLRNSRDQAVPVLDDVNYTLQQHIDWGNATATCNAKANASESFICDYSIYPMASEQIKVCFEARNYFSGEIFVDMSNIYLDNDRGDSIIQLSETNEFVQNGLKSITDSDLYLSESANRHLEADGNLVDGYATLCTNWMSLPDYIEGGNNWDVQGDARLSPDIYNLDRPVRWTWESDEFAIFGTFNSFPEFKFFASETPHYRKEESWVKESPTVIKYNLSAPDFGVNGSTFTFAAHLSMRVLDEGTPLERVRNITVEYVNETAIPYTTQVFSLEQDIIVLIRDVNTSVGDNNFTITVNFYNTSGRMADALVGIENRTGTFRFEVNAASQANLNTNIPFTVTAQIESGEQQKEVKFICYVAGSQAATEISWNRMINSSQYTETRSLFLPESIGLGTHTVTCTINYYNLGSRSDTATDTFLAQPPGHGASPVFDFIRAFIPGLGDASGATLAFLIILIASLGFLGFFGYILVKPNKKQLELT